VDSVSGVLTLQNNHYEAVVLTATTCASKANVASATTTILPNLKPVAVGDVDLGARSGVAVPKQSPGSTFKLRMRVNTGNRKLAAFNLRLQFDPSYLTPLLDSARHLIPSSKGAVDLKFSISEDGNEVLLAAVIQKTQVRATSNGIDIVEIAFTAMAVGETVLTGVVVQLLDNTVGNPQAIGEPNSAFVAGLIPVVIGDTRLRASRQTMDAVYRASTLSVL